jgi:hypothetical protein
MLRNGLDLGKSHINSKFSALSYRTNSYSLTNNTTDADSAPEFDHYCLNGFDSQETSVRVNGCRSQQDRHALARFPQINSICRHCSLAVMQAYPI